MKLSALKQILDAEFEIDRIPPDMPFSKLMPATYQEAGLDLARYVDQGFMEKYHGLMLDNGDTVERVYLGAFFSNELVEKAIAAGAKDALLFFHHPLDLDASGRGFSALDPEYFAKLKSRNLSVYVLHTPLDIHQRIATTKSISKALGLVGAKECVANSVGFSGMYGELPQAEKFEDFTAKLLDLFRIETLNCVKKSEWVRRVGIIAGGGSDVARIREMIELGCDTYVTGDYLNKIENDYGRMQKQAVLEAMDSLDINLIECSHCATEELVLRNELAGFFAALGLPAEVISQDNPWR